MVGGLVFPKFTKFGLYQTNWEGMWKKYLSDIIILNLEPLKQDCRTLSVDHQGNRNIVQMVGCVMASVLLEEQILKDQSRNEFGQEAVQ